MRSNHTGSQHNFAQVPKAEIQRSSFDRSHGRKTTFNSGELIPIFVDWALPGDTWNLKTSLFARLATPIVPFMDNARIQTFFFAIPYRLVWNNFQKFCGEQTDPDDPTDYLIPQVASYSWGENSMADYFGLPTMVAIKPMALPFRAYNLVFNEWFRDQNLIDSEPVPKDDGPDAQITYGGLQRIAKTHDYFTSALPWPQKGPSVPLPLGTSAPVYGETLTSSSEGHMWQSWRPGGPSRGVGRIDITLSPTAPGRTLFAQGTLGSTTANESLALGTPADYAANPTYNPPYADLTNATASTINALRQAFQIQRLYERDARGGTRYTEILKAHFGVTSSDARLQRPEYLGGGSTPINVNPIAQTSASAEDQTPQGNLAAFATASAVGHGFTKSFEEHTIVLGLAAVRADLNYQQGMNRHWSQRGRFDMYWPALAHLGEQAILKKEIYAQGTSADDEAWGYQERWAEYRYKPSEITGRFRSNATQSLDVWHLAQDFSALPGLNAEFIQENAPFDRVIAVEAQSEPQFIADLHFNFRCARPMPTYSVPGLIDHF